ncbi:MAG: hypothetical protein AAF423_11645 [Pseudomonadota bacterium]
MALNTVRLCLFCCALLVSSGVMSPNSAQAQSQGIVSKVTSAPIFANGIVRDIRSGINIFLQTDNHSGDAFLDPAVIGYGIPAGGRMEIELVSGFQRDPAIPLDERAILLVVGTPQQGLPAALSGFKVTEGGNDETFVITPLNQNGLQADALLSAAPGAAFDPIRQRGIKIIHIGRVSAFVSRGDKGVVAVRIIDGGGNVVASGSGEVNFLPEPRPQIFPTNVPHDQRNHNWQRVGVNQILGVASSTLPLPFMLYKKNAGLGNQGIVNAGVLSSAQLAEFGFKLPESLQQFSDGVILQDADGNGFLNPAIDTIIGGFAIEAPAGAQGYQILTPLVSEKPFLSVHTSNYNERAGASIGGAILQVVFIAGNVPGLYKPTFSLLEVPGDPSSGIGSSVTYTIVVE